MICQEETAQDLSDRVREQEEAWAGEDRAVDRVVEEEDKDRVQDQAVSACVLHAEQKQHTSRAPPAHKQNAPSADNP